MTSSILLLSLLLAIPPLDGIDTVPAPAVVADVVGLRAVAVDHAAGVVARSRAVRLLAVHALDDGEIDDVLTLLAATSTGELEVQVALARFDRAAFRSSAAARVVASATQSSSSSSLRKVAAVMWWRLGDVDACAVLRRCASDDVDIGVRGACRARLRARAVRSGSFGPRPPGTSTGDVLKDTPDAGSPASPGR